MNRGWRDVAIAGIGQTEFSKASGRSELQLAVESVSQALADAGLTPADVDGVVTLDIDSTDQALLAGVLGFDEVQYFSSVPYGGGGGCATVMHGAMAIRAEVANVVVAYRAMNERSGVRFGQPVTMRRPNDPPYAAYGLGAIAQIFSLTIAGYMNTYGLTNEDFASYSVTVREHASTNPDAYFYGRPITADDHQDSRWISEPVLRLLDCCMESDGGVAVVLVPAESAKDLPHPSVVVAGAAQGLHGGSWPRNLYGPSVDGWPESGICAEALWKASRMGPSDIQTAMLYDHFGPMALMQFEEFGFCDRGGAADFFRSGSASIGGELPVNPHGGQLGEAYMHGMNGITEAVRQLRGSAVNQVPGAENVLVTSGSGVPTSALVLSRASE